MNYKLKNWQDFEISYLKSFGKNVPIFTPSVFHEYRGEIFTAYHDELHPVNSFLPKNLHFHSRFSKSYKNVLRGLHYDSKTYKLVQAVVGDIYLGVLDLREGSDTYGKFESYILSEKHRHQVLIPPGFANGHYALTDCMFHYYLFYEGEYFDVKDQGVIKFNDTRFKMDWPVIAPTLQERDK